MSNDPYNQIKATLAKYPVVLYMKGTKLRPLCGFSSSVVNILNSLGIDFYDVNVMDNQEIREAIKIYTKWPTIPQLYICEEFIGGCDIVTDLYKNGELASICKNYKINFNSL